MGLTGGPAASVAAAPVPGEPISLALEEKILVVLNKDGGLETMEVQGTIALQVPPRPLSVLFMRETPSCSGCQAPLSSTALNVCSVQCMLLDCFCASFRHCSLSSLALLGTALLLSSLALNELLACQAQGFLDRLIRTAVPPLVCLHNFHLRLADVVVDCVGAGRGACKGAGDD